MGGISYRVEMLPSHLRRSYIRKKLPHYKYMVTSKAGMIQGVGKGRIGVFKTKEEALKAITAFKKRKSQHARRARRPRNVMDYLSVPYRPMKIKF